MKYKKGDIVIIGFPFTDLSSVKKRPALIVSNNIVNATGDFLMVQITTKGRKDELTLPVKKTDFEDEKSLPLDSYLRLHKIFLLNESLVLYKAASVKKVFLSKAINNIVQLFK